ncbi:hypothetical protein ACRAWF_13045 [Streptomyces sp. L7]
MFPPFGDGASPADRRGTGRLAAPWVTTVFLPVLREMRGTSSSAGRICSESRRCRRCCWNLCAHAAGYTEITVGALGTG